MKSDSSVLSPMVKSGTVEMLELRRINVKLSFISLLNAPDNMESWISEDGQARLHNSNKETQYKRII